jgi:hypothetical protein
MSLCKSCLTPACLVSRLGYAGRQGHGGTVYLSGMTAMSCAIKCESERLRSASTASRSDDRAQPAGERGREVKRNLAKVGVEGSNPFARSKFPNIIRALPDHARIVPSIAFIGEAWGKQSTGFWLSSRLHHQNPDADLRAEMRRPQPAGYWDDVRVQVNDKARVASLLLEHAKNPVLGL